MRLALFTTCLALVLTPSVFGADEAPAPTPKKASMFGRGKLPFPVKVEGVSAADLEKIRVAVARSAQEPAVVAALTRLADLFERTKFTQGRQESEDLRLDFDKAQDDLSKAIFEAAHAVDASITKDMISMTFNAMSELRKQRGQEVAAKAKAAQKEGEKANPRPKPTDTKTAASEAPTKPNPSELLADVPGVSSDEMKTFRGAALKARNDPAVKAVRDKMTELKKRAEYASQEEKRELRGESEGLTADLHKATLEAITQLAPSLKKDSAENILYEIEKRMKTMAQKGKGK